MALVVAAACSGDDERLPPVDARPADAAKPDAPRPADAPPMPDAAPVDAAPLPDA